MQIGGMILRKTVIQGVKNSVRKQKLCAGFAIIKKGEIVRKAKLYVLMIRKYN